MRANALLKCAPLFCIAGVTLWGPVVGIWCAWMCKVNESVGKRVHSLMGRVFLHVYKCVCMHASVCVRSRARRLQRKS